MICQSKSKSLDHMINRRTYQKHIQDKPHLNYYTGFTNRILIQETDSKTIGYYIPTYVIFKIKSIQDIDIQKLTGSISCVILIKVLIQDLPQPIVHLLQTEMNIQLNRSDLIELKQSKENNISVIRKGDFLCFTLRKTVNATILEDTLWSPFELIRLIISITFNSIKKSGQEIALSFCEHKENDKKKYNLQDQKLLQQLEEAYFAHKIAKKSEHKKSKSIILFDNSKNYNFSFNCMRILSEIPISYAQNCVYSVYDLAQKLLEVYNTELDSYNQIKAEFKKEPNLIETKKRKQKKTANQSPDGIQSQGLQYLLKFINKEKLKKDEEQSVPKPKYYQYSHFVIPLYKYPGNALATIFIPIFLLALLSLGIFYESRQLQSRMGSIATMILGYIALIPSIKDQLPPSPKITIVERVIYLSTFFCLLSIVQSFLAEQQLGWVLGWVYKNLFIICVIAHTSIFVFVLSLMLLHKFKWQPSYNYDKSSQIPDPVNERHKWINLYCDNEFYITNKSIEEYNAEKKLQLPNGMIRKYTPTIKQIVKQEKKDVQQPVDRIIEITSELDIAQQKEEKDQVLSNKKKNKKNKHINKTTLASKQASLQQKNLNKPESQPAVQIQKVPQQMPHLTSLSRLDSLIRRGSHDKVGLKSQTKLQAGMNMSKRQQVLKKNK